MRIAPQPRAIRLSADLYGWLLVLYPRAYRRRYGAEMQRTFGDCCRFAYLERGAGGVLLLWLPTLMDLVKSAAEKHREYIVSLRNRRLYRFMSFISMLVGLIGGLTPFGVVREILVAPFLVTIGLAGLYLTSEGGLGVTRQSPALADARIQRAYNALLGAAVFAGAFFYNAMVAGLRSGEQYPGGAMGYLSMVDSHLAFFLLGLWLYQRGSLWAFLPSMVMGATWIYYRSSNVLEVVSGHYSGALLPNVIGLGSFVFSVAAVVTGLLAIPALRNAPAQEQNLNVHRRMK